MIEIPPKKKRTFLPEELEIKDWSSIEPYYKDLKDREINSEAQLRQWFKDKSELDSVISEDLGWRYIRMTCNTEDEEASRSYQYFIQEINPKISPYDNELNKKALGSPFLDKLDDQGYDIMIRSMKKEVEIFREENIPLKTKDQTLAQEFSQITGKMTVKIDGNEMTLSQAAVLLQSQDRELRKSVYEKIQGRRLEDKEDLNHVFNEQILVRDEVARNSDFKNFRDYMFAAMGRFDYEPQDCFNFHDSVEKEVVPLLDDLAEDRKVKMGLENLRPWDNAADKSGKQALKPFVNGKDLLEKSIECFSRVDPFLGERLEIMDKMGHLDLESKKGKAPGGYNYPLSETGVPFIFMNATSTLRDMVTLMHEGGHAVHSFLNRDLELVSFKHPPSEVAELASMSMELISMDHWDVFFKNEEECNRAKKEHLEQIIETLPWVALIDKFQHWIYENAGHTSQEREDIWVSFFNRFNDTITDWKGLDINKKYLWQKQLHLYEVPFYYIEYGFAQLGAIAVWKNYRENPEKGLKNYLDALSLGYTKSIPEVYKAAGIKFDFSNQYIKELIEFVRIELDQIEE